MTASSQEIPLSQVSCSSYAAPDLNVVNAAFLAPSAASSVESTPLMSTASGVVVISSVDAGASLQLPVPALSVNEDIPDLFLSPSPRSENFVKGRWGEPNFNPEGSVPLAAQKKKKGAAETSLTAQQKPKGPRPPPKERQPLPLKKKKKNGNREMQRYQQQGGTGKRVVLNERGKRTPIVQEVISGTNSFDFIIAICFLTTIICCLLVY
jgi:hypothetical protein